MDEVLGAKPRIPGSFLRIELADETYGYGRIIDDYGNIAFYRYRTHDASSDLDAIERQPVLFTVMVRTFRETPWRIIGCRELRGDVAKPVVKFTQDLADYRKCEIYDSSGMRREATPEECVGLERAASWDPHHVERRLLDNVLGKTNVFERETQPRLHPDT